MNLSRKLHTWRLVHREKSAPSTGSSGLPYARRSVYAVTIQLEEAHLNTLRIEGVWLGVSVLLSLCM